MDKEIRLVDFENRSQDEMVLDGYAAIYDSTTVLYKIDGVEYKEVIQRGAFESADFKDCCLKYNHENSVPILARTRGGSLKVEPDQTGLHFNARLFNTQISRDVYTLVNEGALDKCSFAFTISQGGDEYNRETRTRTITQIDKVWDCSIVDVPAYESTSVQARSFFELEREKELMDMRERERQARKIRILMEVMNGTIK